ncbi:MAG: MFS transporter [Nostoc sp. DedQUE08]|uniref:MFS transporter n=1 Tax=Nostoc sp. DedQUE08 TaxID=3075393 RepID=UPI002AD50C2C|nr:MFS transporter [Nostoc sp. DedQUE08]MDZ8065395.1 MFS transporter [Nostoc sp. DedQUE08]
MMSNVQMIEKTRLTALREMQLFIIVWIGQLIALIGSSTTAFALDIWVYNRTGSVTQFALISLFNTLPLILISPIAGPLVDRWDRRKTMIFADVLACLGTIAIGVLFVMGRLEVWHIYLANTFTAVFMAFHMPAYTASTVLLVPKQHLNRANGLMSLMYGISIIIAPTLGGILLSIVHFQGIILLHVTSVSIAVVSLMLVLFPQVNTSVVATAKSSFLSEATYGFTYLTARPGLLGLILFSASSLYLVGGINVITVPLALNFVSVSVLGTILSLFGIAILAGGLLVSIWGGLERNIYAIYGCMLLNGVFIIAAGLQPSLVIFTASIFLFSLTQPIVSSSTQAVMQKKVEPSVQGRVFAIKGAIEAAALPLGYITIGPLAEKVFEPLMATDGYLAGSIGQIIGVGSGRGMGLLLIIMGVLTILETSIAYLYPRLRFVEDELPNVSNAVAIATDTPSSKNDAVSLVS